MVVLSPFTQYNAKSKSYYYRNFGPDLGWVELNFLHILQEWEKVLDALDVHTTLSV